MRGADVVDRLVEVVYPSWGPARTLQTVDIQSHPNHAAVHPMIPPCKLIGVVLSHQYKFHKVLLSNTPTSKSLYHIAPSEAAELPAFGSHTRLLPADNQLLQFFRRFNVAIVASHFQIDTKMGGPIDTGTVYNAALKRRQALMGASGARALLKNFRVFSIAAFACIGGVLYGYNQGMFSGVLTMNSFKGRK